jgi:hypothetical protein
MSQNDEVEMPRLPSPQRPRLKLKRRVVSQLSAPTQQFLASVAAADVPIPSIEEPETEPRDFNMGGITALTRQIHGDDDRDMYLLRPRGRTFSPPKTPAPDCVPSLSPTRYPNWTIDSAISSVESTPEYESSRPSTSRSTQTSASLFSRISHLSDDCGDFDEDVKDRYVLSPDDDIALRGAADVKSKKLRKAPWTKAMSDHLWSTFVLYLQDPKVTPFRMGKNSIPPHGVMLRVSREAKRSWKGSKPFTKATNPSEGRKSGSSTPTAESSGAFIQWPHTCAATRGHLRELCRLRAASGAKNHKFLSRSPTPFNQAAARHWNRRSTPARGPSAFAQDMSMSLALSTSESMQPHGPLAQLTGSSPGPVDRAKSPAFAGPALTTYEGEPSFAERQERQRLGSPFGARSYGPSSSNSLAAALGLNSPMPRRLTHTVGPRRTLQSPVRLSRSSTQKRRHTQSSEPRKRPTMGFDMWIDPNNRAGPAVEATRSAVFSSTSSGLLDDPFVPRIPAEPMLSTSISLPNVAAQLDTPALPPPRLGSPFSVSTTSTSFSFPNRIHRMQQGGSVDLGMLGRPFFATIQQGAESSTAQSARPGLVGRLAYIDQRLKEFNRRDAARRRSDSPV